MIAEVGNQEGIVIGECKFYRLIYPGLERRAAIATVPPCPGTDHGRHRAVGVGDDRFIAGHGHRAAA
jgi:hypothetical protein